jgi:hypothetical protein
MAWSVQSEPLWEEHMPGGHSSLLWNMVHTENLWKIRQLPPSIQAAIIYAIILTQITRLAEPPVRTIVVCWGKNGKFPMKVEVVKIKTWSAYFVDAGWGWVVDLSSSYIQSDYYEKDFLFLLKSQTDSCFSSSKTVFLFNLTKAIWQACYKLTWGLEWVFPEETKMGSPG